MDICVLSSAPRVSPDTSDSTQLAESTKWLTRKDRCLKGPSSTTGGFIDVEADRSRCVYLALYHHRLVLSGRHHLFANLFIRRKTTVKNRIHMGHKAGAESTHG